MGCAGTGAGGGSPGPHLNHHFSTVAFLLLYHYSFWAACSFSFGAAQELEQEAAALDLAAEQEAVESPTVGGHSSEADGTGTGGEEGKQGEEGDEDEEGDEEEGEDGEEGEGGEDGGREIGEGVGAEDPSVRQAGGAHEQNEQEGE